MPKVRAKVVLADIEGTTTSISFVKDVLFPYAKEHCYTFLEKTWSDENTHSVVEELKNLPQYKEYLTENPDSIEKSELQQITDFVHHLIERDLKLKPLKTLQGYIWEHGYKDGTLVGHVYDDVPGAFKRWQQNGLKVAIYSSGSIWAQKLLFGKTKYGSLLDYLSAHFDTTSGMKTESQSYKNISKELEVDSAEVLFLTDIIKEAAAAREAGMQVVVVSRPGNAALTDEEKASYTVVQNFDEIVIKTE